VALLRHLLGAGCESARVTAVRAAGPLVEGPGRQGWPEAPQPREAGHTVAMIEFAAGVGVYDFTDGQWFNPLR
jgi:hypothetical protein